LNASFKIFSEFLMGWLAICAVAALAVVDVRVATLDGNTVEGPLRSLGSADVQVGGDATGPAEHIIALDQVLSISRLEPTATTRPAARAGLAGGSRIAISQVSTEGAQAQLAVRNQASLSVPLKQLRWIRFGSPAAAVDPQWLGLVDRPRSADALVVRRPGDAIDEVSGIVLGIGQESVSFDLDGDTMQAPRARLEGLLFASTAADLAADQGKVIVDDIDGSRWVAISLGPGRDGEVELNLGSGLLYRLPLDRIEKVEMTGAVEFLAGLPAAAAGYAAHLSLGLPGELATTWLGPESDAGRDLLMRATSHLEVRVPDGSQTLLGSFEFDQRVAAGGNCVVRVLVDSQPVWEQTLDVSDPSPRGFELPLGGARRVRLEVAAGADGDLGDTVRVRQPRMMK
jgi:hypothetical protein